MWAAGSGGGKAEERAGDNLGNVGSGGFCAGCDQRPSSVSLVIPSVK